MKAEKLKLELLSVTALSIVEQKTVTGGNGTKCWFWLLGAMFMTPGAMAVNGSGGHEIMGTK